MLSLVKLLYWIFIPLFAITVYANPRPTLQFDGQTFYLASFYNEVDNNYSPVNVIEFYLPVGETSDNYSKSIKRITFLEVSDYRASASARLHEYKEDNREIPSEVIEEPKDKKVIVNLAFWWPFRPSIVYKSINVFQEDKLAKRAMCYIYTELQFNDLAMTHQALKSQGKALLIEERKVNLFKNLSF